MNPGILSDRSEFRRLEGEPLPIFSRPADDLTLFYAPGYLAAADAKTAEEIRDIILGEIPFGNLIAGHLINAAVSAQSQWARIRDVSSYHPVCLTVYSSLACNLNCSYCFAKAEREPALMLDTEFILAAAREVLANCVNTGSPFTAVFHGGGEPSLDPRLPSLLECLRGLSEAEGVPFYSYIATNGVMEEEKARWIAEHFDAVGLSVDGSPEVQNAQRPLRSGGESAPAVERTAAILKEIQGRLNVRVTVPHGQFGRVGEITEYLAGTLHADETHLEPAYQRGSEPDPEAAELFCAQFLRAKQALREAGVLLTFSGSRVGEIHGRYCQIFRQVKHLVPPDGSSVCFVMSSRREAEYSGLAGLADEFIFEELSREDPACEDCFCRYHCARGCPDACPALSENVKDAGSFRCRVNRMLTEAGLLETAASTLFETARQYGFAGVELRGV